MYGLIKKDFETSAHGEDLSPLWNSFINKTKRGRPHHIRVKGIWSISAPLDFTGFRGENTLDFTGTQLWAKFSSLNTAVFDMAGSSGVIVRALRVFTLPGCSPGMGLLLCRDENLKSSGKHHFDACRFDGRFNLAAVYNVGSEMNQWFGGRVGNSGGKCSIYHGKFKKDSIHSPYISLGEGSSASGARFYGLHMLDTGYGDRAAFEVEGFRMISADSLYAASARRTQLGFYTNRVAISGLHFPAVFFHGAKSIAPNRSVEIKGAHEAIGVNLDCASNRREMIVDVKEFRNSSITWTNAIPLTISDRTKIDNVRLNHYSESEAKVNYNPKSGDTLWVNGNRL